MTKTSLCVLAATSVDLNFIDVLEQEIHSEEPPDILF